MGRKKRNRYRTNGANALKEPVSFKAKTPAAIQSDQSVAVDPKLEYLAGYGLGYGTTWQNLAPQSYDRNAPDINFDTYRQMLNDPEISSDVRTLRDMVLADGVQMVPAFQGKAVDEDAKEFARAMEIAEFCERNLSGPRKPLKKTLKGLLEGAIVYGHKVAEITWKLGEGIDRNKLVLDKIALKDYRTLDFVIDRYWNLLGFTARSGTRSLTGQEIIPVEKFVLLNLHEEDEDPRGRSSIRPAYTAWQFKLMTWPEYFRWLCNCALPTTVGKTAPKQPGGVERNADGTAKTGGKQLTAQQEMGLALAELKNSGYIVVPNGAEVDQLGVVSEGAGFDRAINVADGQIIKSILYQTLATSEAEFGTRAQSQTHMQVLDLLVWEIKGELADTVTNGLIKKIITYNFGEQMLPYAPIVSLGDTERRDWSEDAGAAALLEPALTDSQWNAVTMQLQIPAPLPGERPRREAIVAMKKTPPMSSDEEDAMLRSKRRARLDKFVSVQVRRAA